MPWREQTTVSLREEFVRLASSPDACMSSLCERFSISRKTGYKWLSRYRTEGVAGLEDRSRRPQHSSGQKVTPAMEAAILDVRVKRRWGGRKIHHYLVREGWPKVPGPSIITRVIQRHDLPPLVGPANVAPGRFEASAPNQLWQMDFKGPIGLRDGVVEPLTVLDDHSRFNLGLLACRDKTTATVQQALTDLFRRYGMPWRLLADNGKPWGAWLVKGRCVTQLEVWLMILDVILIHSRPRHPQTCGKDERFHRTLKQELTGRSMNCALAECQGRFDAWRDLYNLQRPHEALNMQVPASCYQVSEREFPEVLPEPQYDSTDEVRIVRDKGRVRYRGEDYRVGEAFKGHPVAIRATENIAIKQVYFYRQKIADIDLNTKTNVLPISENDV